jgi:hypothetical protein
MMASVSEDELAHLSGAELIAHLSDTYRRADFDVVALILKARDLRDARIMAELRAVLTDLDTATARGCGDAEVMAELQATLTEMEAVRDMSKALLDVFPPMQAEAEEMAPMAEGAATLEPPHQEEPCVEVEAKDPRPSRTRRPTA